MTSRYANYDDTPWFFWFSLQLLCKKPHSPIRHTVDERAGFQRWSRERGSCIPNFRGKLCFLFWRKNSKPGILKGAKPTLVAKINRYPTIPHMKHMKHDATWPATSKKKLPQGSIRFRLLFVRSMRRRSFSTNGPRNLAESVGLRKHNSSWSETHRNFNWRGFKN